MSYTNNTNSIVINSKLIEVKKESSAAILGETSTITNSGTGADGIVLTAKKTAGIIASSNSVVSNTGRIETSTVSPTAASEGLVGISLNNSQGTNSGNITLGTAYSTGMFGVATSTLTNSGTISGNQQNTVGMATKASTAINTGTGTINLSGIKSTGMFGLSVGSDKSTLTNSGTISGTGVETVGIAVNNSTATNSNGATISLEGNTSTGIFGVAS